jgi:hypothetical protein
MSAGTRKPETTPGTETPKKKSGGRKVGDRSLTVAQRAEAASLWRSGTVTLDDLAKKFKKRPETFSRLFARMGIEKGSGAAAAMKKAEEALAARAATDAEETLKRIAQVKDTHFKMTQSIAVMAFRELQQAKAAGLDIAGLKDTLGSYKLMTEILGNSRKELWALLNVEKHDAAEELSDLPDLTVRELTQSEVNLLRDTPDDDGMDAGEGMLSLSDDELDVA